MLKMIKLFSVTVLCVVVLSSILYAATERTIKYLPRNEAVIDRSWAGTPLEVLQGPPSVCTVGTSLLAGKKCFSCANLNAKCPRASCFATTTCPNPTLIPALANKLQDAKLFSLSAHGTSNNDLNTRNNNQAVCKYNGSTVCDVNTFTPLATKIPFTGVAILPPLGDCTYKDISGVPHNFQAPFCGFEEFDCMTAEPATAVATECFGVGNMFYCRGDTSTSSPPWRPVAKQMASNTIINLQFNTLKSTCNLPTNPARTQLLTETNDCCKKRDVKWYIDPLTNNHINGDAPTGVQQRYGRDVTCTGCVCPVEILDKVVNYDPTLGPIVTSGEIDQCEEYNYTPYLKCAEDCLIAARQYENTVNQRYNTLASGTPPLSNVCDASLNGACESLTKTPPTPPEFCEKIAAGPDLFCNGADSAICTSRFGTGMECILENNPASLCRNCWRELTYEPVNTKEVKFNSRGNEAVMIIWMMNIEPTPGTIPAAGINIMPFYSKIRVYKKTNLSNPVFQSVVHTQEITGQFTIYMSTYIAPDKPTPAMPFLDAGNTYIVKLAYYYPQVFNPGMTLQIKDLRFVVIKSKE